jgi:hypothetical protein
VSEIRFRLTQREAVALLRDYRGILWPRPRISAEVKLRAAFLSAFPKMDLPEPSRCFTCGTARRATGCPDPFHSQPEKEQGR